MFNCRSLIVILFLGIISTVHDGSAASSEVIIRDRRDSGGNNVNLLQLFFKLEKLVSNCKRANAPPPNNKTNGIVQFIESHDLQCLIDGAIKIYEDMNPKQSGSRRKRDASSFFTQLIKLTEEMNKCKKADPQGAGNSTNFIEEILNNYDLGCLLKRALTFIQSISRDSNKNRAKRSIKFGDLTCFALKVLDEEDKITNLVKSFQPEHRRKQTASSEKTCNDFGVVLDSLIEFVGDFAPPSNSTPQS